MRETNSAFRCLMDDDAARFIQRTPTPPRDGANYRVRALLAIAILCATGMIHCKSAEPTTTPAEDDLAESSSPPAEEARTSSELVLFDAILAEASARGYGLQTVSEKFFMVVTEPEQVSDRLRKQRIMKIIILPRGGALNVRVNYERDSGSADAPDWQVMTDERIREKAAKEEMELARAIEERFHLLRRERR